MKLPIFITGSALVLALSIWGANFFVDHQTAIPSARAKSIVPKTSTLPAEKTIPTGNIPISDKMPVARMEDRAVGNTPPPPAGPSVAAPQSASVVQQRSSAASKKLTQATAVSRVSGGVGPSVSAAPTSHSPVSAAGPGVLEVDPGVPVPAAFMPSHENLSPAAASAQQQLADSFVQNVTSQPAGDNTEQTYNDTLSKSDAAYQSLYGNEAANRAGMQALLDAGAGK